MDAILAQKGYFTADDLRQAERVVIAWRMSLEPRTAKRDSPQS